MGSKKQANVIVKWRSFLNLKYLKLAIKLGISGALSVALSVVAIDRWVSWQAKEQIYKDIEQVPNYEVAVVLGTSKYLGRTLNEYYSHRIDAAIELYDQGKTDNFLLSGDNAHRSYNEPWTMKRDLLKAGIPEQSIYLDYAGFRTLDSVVRAKAIFDTDDFLIVTQQFHCERALFIANQLDIKANCLAVSGPISKQGYSVRMREVFARTKAFIDLFITHTQPKFLGPKEPIIKRVESADSELDVEPVTEQLTDQENP
ncbi:SanA/YdcF family protein [Vibrio maerlii]|uniref:SanA/YdcF family protein n=1 Tax=Vibrio maerlii TaxID=2231648 RepID=UPI003B84AE9B